MRLILLLLVALLQSASHAADISVADSPDKNGLQPRLFVDGKGTLHALWYSGDDRGGDVFHATRNSDKSWSSPVRVSAAPV